MRPVSLKRAKQDRRLAPQLAALRAERPWCQICGRAFHDLELHEIIRGPGRQRARGQRCATLVLCRACHERVGHAAEWPKAKQLAVLQITEPADYDLDAFRALNGPAEILQSEVDAFVSELRKGPYGYIFDRRAAG